jgi:hypothetical protein
LAFFREVPVDDLRRAKEPVTVLAGPYGHPFHPIMVTVPIGAWVASFVFDIGSRLVSGDAAALATGSRWLIAIGVLGATGGDLAVFQTADRFAGVAGLAPAARDSGRITGNHHRPRRYDRRLLRVFYLSGLSALKSCPASRTYYDRKRTEGKTHIQAMLSLARRRLNVLWAMLRDGTTYTQQTKGVAVVESGFRSGPVRV